MNSEENHFPEKASNRIIVYQDVELKHLFSKLQHVQPNVEQTNKVLNKICDLLLQHFQAQMDGESFFPTIRPIFILRGGLFLLSAFQRTGMQTPYGLIIPLRSMPGTHPKIIYADLPICFTDGTYLIMDLIVNTGATILESLRIISKALNRIEYNGYSIHVISPFMTAKAINKIHEEFPNVVFHTFWNNMDIGKDNRLVGLGFDGGDYACGGGPRIHFPNVKINNASRILND